MVHAQGPHVCLLQRVDRMAQVRAYVQASVMVEHTPMVVVRRYNAILHTTTVQPFTVFRKVKQQRHPKPLYLGVLM